MTDPSPDQSGHPDRPVVLVMGPTASGKTSLSVRLAEELPGGGEIITCDSMQVYAGMDIGTAKPTEAERRGIPHHLLDLTTPDDDGFTVDSWLDATDEAIRAINARGKWPIVAGGTVLYVQALLYGLDFGPAPNEAIREELRALDRETRRAELERVDPVSAARIHANDDRRTIRALEVFRIAGEPLSGIQRDWSIVPKRQGVRIIGLDWPVPDINRRINARVRQMMEDGLLEETRSLLAGPGLGEQARQALGYRQIIDFLESEDAAHPGERFDAGLDRAVEQIKIRTRRYGKQQRTWLRRFRGMPGALFLDASQQDPQNIVNTALTHSQATG